MSKHTERNNKADYRQIKKAADRVGRMEQRVTEEYFDLKCGCFVRVLKSEEVPYRTRLVGYSE